MPYDPKEDKTREPLYPKLATREARLKARNERLASLRERSGLSMDELAKEMGFKGQSSIQRYMSPDYDKGFRPELAARFKAALVGRGDPPIAPSELAILDNWAESKDGTTHDLVAILAENYDAGEPMETYRERLRALGLDVDRSHIASTLNKARSSRFLDGADPNARVAGLPLEEGDVIIRMPKHISPEGVETLRNWLEHLVNLASKPRIDEK